MPHRTSAKTGRWSSCGVNTMCFAGCNDGHLGDIYILPAVETYTTLRSILHATRPSPRQYNATQQLSNDCTYRFRPTFPARRSIEAPLSERESRQSLPDSGLVNILKLKPDPRAEPPQSSRKRCGKAATMACNTCIFQILRGTFS